MSSPATLPATGAGTTREDAKHVPRPRNQEARRRELHAAARRAIAERTTRVRLKDIADQAGLAPASVLYYYPDVDVLLREAFLSATERFAERRRCAVERLDDPRDQLVEMIGTGLPLTPDDEDVVILYEGAGLIRHDPGLAEIVRNLTDLQVELYRRILERGSANGVFSLRDDARAIARNLVALEDAYGLYIVDVGLPYHEARAEVESFARIATGCDLVAAEAPAAVGRDAPGQV